MKKIKKLIAGAVLVASITALVGCSNTKNDTVLAVVNGRQITLADVDSELHYDINILKEENGANFEKKLDEETKAEFNNKRAMVLNMLIQEEVLLKKADELDLVPSDEELDKLLKEQIESYKQAYGVEGLETIKKESGYDDNKFNSVVKSQIIQKTLFDDITKDVKVSDEEIEKYYKDNKDTLFTQKPGAYTKHILFKEEKDAQKCLDEINSGATTFEEAFNKYSSNSGNEEYPLSEDLDYVEYEEANFDEKFLAGLKPLKVNEVSSPIESSFGFHLIQVSKIEEKSIVTPFEEIKDKIKDFLLSAKQQELFSEKAQEWMAEIEINITAESIGYMVEENEE